MVKACFICGSKDVRLFEIRSNMKQRQKWFEASETFCGKQIYGDNDKHNLLICICNIKDYKNYGLLRNLCFLNLLVRLIGFFLPYETISCNFYGPLNHHPQ
jgi:hypothetical protein